MKLQPLGFRVSFRPVTRAELRSGTTSELTLQTVLLPPSAPAAIELVLDLGSLKAPASLHAAPDAATQDKVARDLALSTQPELDVIPLCVQGLGVATGNELQHLTRDAMGLPRLDDVFLSSE